MLFPQEAQERGRIRQWVPGGLRTFLERACLYHTSNGGGGGLASAPAAAKFALASSVAISDCRSGRRAALAHGWRSLAGRAAAVGQRTGKVISALSVPSMLVTYFLKKYLSTGYQILLLLYSSTKFSNLELEYLRYT